jgi:uncharacterized protein
MPDVYPDELGIGVIYTPAIARALDLCLIDVIEIEPQMFWSATGDPDNPVGIDFDLFSQLRAAPQHKLVHSVTLPVGNSRPHEPRDLERLAQCVAALGPPYTSEHLSFNRFGAETGDEWTGFLLPSKQDENGVEIAALRIDEMRRAVGTPVAFETNVNYLRRQPDEMSDGRFVRRVAETADCGILLDLHNLLTNERNGRDGLKAVFAEIPRERVWEIHLAGGMRYRDYWLDSHSGHIENELFDAAREVVDACPNLRAIIFEIMPQYIDANSGEGLQEDVRRMRSLWSARKRSRSAGLGARPVIRDKTLSAPNVAAARRREETLGALAQGKKPDDPERAIADDPAAALYADLVASMREGVLYEASPFLLRLLLAALGRAATLNLISAYRATLPPQLFGGEETRGFLRYVRTLGLETPYLSAVLDLEEALNAVQMTGEARVVLFGYDPAVLLSALAENRLPPLLAREGHEILVSLQGLEFRNSS